MSDKFQNKYRIPSARLLNWDYGANAIYFVTICTHNKECFFGRIVDSQMQLSEIGFVATQCWQQITDHFPYAKLYDSVVMPNHLHGIIAIDKPKDVCVHTGNGCRGGFARNKNPMVNDNLSRVVRWYKGRVSFESRKTSTLFAWQPLFHDHIIRDDESFQRISNYIINNPANWLDDKWR